MWNLCVVWFFEFFLIESFMVDGRKYFCCFFLNCLGWVVVRNFLSDLVIVYVVVLGVGDGIVGDFEV